MDLLYVTNPGSNDLRWGTPLGGGLTVVIPLGFAGHRIVAMPGQRYLYITGNKIVNGDIHAWLAVIDTCNNTVLAPEVDLGIGFAGQCAVPDSVGGNRAYVAISQAVGERVLQGADSRIEVLNVLNPVAPVRLPGPITPSTQSSPYGFLHIVWSFRLNTLYASHRGDNRIYYFTPLGGQANLQSFSAGNEQPMGLGISNDGLVLFIARRLAGDVLEFDLLAQPPAQIGMPIPLPNADTRSGMFIAVASQDRVLVTSTRQQDGFLNIIQHQRPQAPAPQIQSIDTTGTRLGQPAVNPDSTVVYVPRGDQNDVAQIDLPNATLFPGFLASSRAACSTATGLPPSNPTAPSGVSPTRSAPAPSTSDASERPENITVAVGGRKGDAPQFFRKKTGAQTDASPLHPQWGYRASRRRVMS